MGIQDLRVPHILRWAFQALGRIRLRTFPFIRQGGHCLGLLAPMDLRLDTRWRCSGFLFFFTRLNAIHHRHPA